MLDEKLIVQEISQIEGLGVLVKAYAEIASVRMKKTRVNVLANRDFLAEIVRVFDEVRASYAKEILALSKRKGLKKGEKITFLGHNGKTVSVLLSANTGLYGEIVQSTLNLFMGEVRKNISEVTIIGKHGLSLFLGEERDRPYSYFDLPDDKIESTQLSNIIRHIVQYEEIHVFYGKFQSVIKQIPSTFEISAGITLSEERSKTLIKYLFEPSLEKILMFFETEIFGSLFEQVVRESALAKFASRVMAMNRADGNIKEELKRLLLEKTRINHRTLNRKQLNSLISAYGYERKYG